MCAANCEVRCAETCLMQAELDIRLPAGARVAVAMSGGVDSSTVAALLVEAGFEVIGLTARLYDVDSADLETVRRAGTCCAPDDARDARSVSRKLGIRHYVLDEREAFAAAVTSKFIDDWRNARTPNPCVECNRTLKFERLTEHARTLGAAALATGHYARLGADDAGRPLLRRAIDQSKDQAYFLYPLRPEVASFVRFPLGTMSKAEVRAHARRLGVAVADKPESMDICFTAGRTPAQYVGEHGAAVSGHIVDVNGTRLAKHANLAKFTVGQRKGLGIATAASTEPRRFVLDKRADGTVVVGPRELLQVHALRIQDYSSVVGDSLTVGQRVTVQVRHRGTPVAAEVTNVMVDCVEIAVLSALEGAARGQSAVLWHDGRVLGGGIIADVRSAGSERLRNAAARAPGAA